MSSFHESSIAVIVGRGREIPKPHLDTHDWGSLQGRVIEWLVCYAQYFRCAYSTGYDLATGPEEQCTIFGSVPDYQLDAFRTKLAELAALYDQGAILLLVGDLEVITVRPM